MLDGESRSASVQAMTKARLCMITRDAFRRRLAEQPELAFHVIQTLIHRVRALSRSVQGLVSMDVCERIVRMFHERAQTRDVRGPGLDCICNLERNRRTSVGLPLFSSMASCSRWLRASARPPALRSLTSGSSRKDEFVIS